MKKLFFVFTVLIVLLALGYAQNTSAQQNAAPPLLIQQYPGPAVPPSTLGMPSAPAGIPPGPGTPPAAPGVTPLPGPRGIPVVQTISTQALQANLQQAMATSQKLNKMMTPGKVWIMRTPVGELGIKGGLLYQGVVVAVLHFNPLDGNVLPLGINPHEYRSNIQIQSIKSNLSSVIGKLKILSAAEFMEPEASWSFPVAMGNSIVAHIKVYYDGIHVLQDYAANQEMTFYGQ